MAARQEDPQVLTRSASCWASALASAKPPLCLTRSMALCRPPASWKSLSTSAASSALSGLCSANSTGPVMLPLARSWPCRGQCGADVSESANNGARLKDDCALQTSAATNACLIQLSHLTLQPEGSQDSNRRCRRLCKAMAEDTQVMGTAAHLQLDHLLLVCSSSCSACSSKQTA